MESGTVLYKPVISKRKLQLNKIARFVLLPRLVYLNYTLLYLRYSKYTYLVHKISSHNKYVIVNHTVICPLIHCQVFGCVAQKIIYKNPGHRKLHQRLQLKLNQFSFNLYHWKIDKIQLILGSK